MGVEGQKGMRGIAVAGLVRSGIHGVRADTVIEAVVGVDIVDIVEMRAHMLVEHTERQRWASRDTKMVPPEHFDSVARIAIAVVRMQDIHLVLQYTAEEGHIGSMIVVDHNNVVVEPLALSERHMLVVHPVFDRTAQQLVSTCLAFP
jgi:hypothetical protein